VIVIRIARARAIAMQLRKCCRYWSKVIAVAMVTGRVRVIAVAMVTGRVRVIAVAMVTGRVRVIAVAIVTGRVRVIAVAIVTGRVRVIAVAIVRVTVKVTVTGRGSEEARRGGEEVRPVLVKIPLRAIRRKVWLL